MSTQHLRICVTPRAADVYAKRFENPKDVPRCGPSIRRQVDLSTRYRGDLTTWLDESGNKKTGAAVIIQKSGHDMKLVTSPVILELCLMVLQVGKANSVKSRGSLINIMDLGMGVLVMITRESNNLFSKDECWYFFVWMLKEGRLYLFDAASRDQYVTSHPDNEQRRLMRMLAEGDMRLDKGLYVAVIIAAVGTRITIVLKLGDEELWMILKGETPLSDNISKNLSKWNTKQPSAPNLGGNYYKSAADGSDLAQPMNFSTYMKLRGAPVEHVESPSQYRRLPLQMCRLPDVGPGQHDGVVAVVDGGGDPIFTEGPSVGRDPVSSGSARRARSRLRGSTSPPAASAANQTRVGAMQRKENEAAAALVKR